MQLPGRLKVPLLIFLGALLVRVVVLALAYQAHSDTAMLSLTPDSINYVGAARALLHDGFLAHRSELFYFPVGYPLFLAINFFFWGEHALPILVFQILISAGTCTLVFLLAQELGLMSRLGILAGLLYTTSVTSISLSCLLLSDTLYAFVFAASLLSLVQALNSGRLLPFVSAGVLGGIATLVRPTGKFWPLAAVLVALIYYGVQRLTSASSFRFSWALLRGVAVTCLLACLIPVPWVLRNAHVHGFPVLAITTISARSTVAAKAMADVNGQNYRTIQENWEQECIGQQTDRQTSLEDFCRCAMVKTQEVEAKHPLQVIRAYAGWAWENINEPDYLLPVVLPTLEKDVASVNGFQRGNGMLRIWFYLAVAGLIILAIGKHFLPLIVLGMAYGYCACTIGAFPYQGSRYFLPGEIAGSILIATTIVFSIHLGTWISKRLINRSTHR
jgi:4-amino-4-deoxy-L-arabinose transferase-like glycosyltransferase